MVRNCVVCNEEFETVARKTICCNYNCKMKMPCIKCGKVDRYKSGDCGYCRRKNGQKRYWENLEKEKQRKIEYYKINKDKINKRGKVWKKNNPNKIKKWRIKSRKEHPEKQRSNVRRYRALKKNLPHKKYDFILICEFYGNICLCCKKKKKLTVDHVIPLSWGNCPGDIPSNIQPLCLSCNSGKRNYHDTDYRYDKGIEMVKYLDKEKTPKQ